MRFNSGSSIKNNAYSSSSASSNTNEKLKKLNEELDQLELLVSSMQTSISSANSKIGTDTVVDQIAAAKTEIENAIGQEVTTQYISASRADIDTIVSNIIHTDQINPSEEDSIEVTAEVKVPSVKLTNAAAVSKTNDIKVPDGAIAWIGHSLVVNKGNGNALIFSKTGDFSYHFVDDDLFIYLNKEVRLSYIYTDEPVEVIAHQDYEYTSVNSGLTVVGPFYADLTEANFQNINANTISTDLFHSTVASIDKIVSHKAQITDLEAGSAEIYELDATEITSDRINSSQIHTKVEKENIGYTTIPEHQDTELYAIAVPITNGIWEIELENSIKATISKANSAVEVVYWRNNSDSLPYIGVKDDKLYIYTRDSGKVYFSNNTLESEDTTVEIYAPTSPGYPILDNLDQKFEIITKNGVVNTTTTYVGDLIVTGGATITETTADDIYVIENDTDNEFYPTFVDSNNEDPESEKLYTNSKISVNPNEGSLSVSKVKTPRLEYTDSSIIISAAIQDTGSNDLILMADGENESAVITLQGKRNSDSEITMGTNVSINNNLTVNNAEKVSNKFYVGPTLSSADLAQLADNALVIMGE